MTEQTERHSQCTYSAWETFLMNGEIEGLNVRKEILESWKRCRELKVDPYCGRSTKMLATSKFEALREKRKILIDVARPFMDKLYQFVSCSGFVVLLSNEEGYLLATIGANQILRKDYDLNLRPGALWMEREVGTNSIGTVLILKRPFQISGTEHYCCKHHSLTCSGAPIRDDRGKIIGILEMSGPVQRTHLHTLGMVVAAVEAIEQQLRVGQKNRKLSLLNNSLNNIFMTVSDGVIVVDIKGQIQQINPVAEKMFTAKVQSLKNNNIALYLDCWEKIYQKMVNEKECSNIDALVSTNNGVMACVVTAKPIYDNNDDLTGGVLFLNPLHTIKKLVNQYSGSHATFTFENIIGKGDVIQKAVKMSRLVARNESNVLLCGESGTGKEMFAQAIHNKSLRRNGPFIAINCGAIPRELIGSELFGYVEGAFTGARKKGRPGKFELASGGTIFLDEIGDMPLEQQVALLRVLQEKSITRIGSDKVVVVDARIICATNKDLKLEVSKGNFRQDLYYRLNVISIVLPPLRMHREDIPLMLDVFLAKTCREIGSKTTGVSPLVVEHLLQYDWPGNVREFQNVVERMVNISAGEKIGLDHLPEEIFDQRFPSIEQDHGQQVPDILSERKKIKELLAVKERDEILRRIHENQGNISKVARDMGISRSSVYRKIKKVIE
ncbi:sigma-54-dependent Fis family transcriptional regulator [Desulfogranum japonicum]|uniref:sigma-54-dependent Fis family transcriptional regulator n=1 Tax=Desulfogranum japonicum TaxID=231447 RepID=UPI00048E2572|nr:sigma-54-dependent Fis family transcriptional regulator [Desulfogranum japonicum]